MSALKPSDLFQLPISGCDADHRKAPPPRSRRESSPTARDDLWLGADRHSLTRLASVYRQVVALRAFGSLDLRFFSGFALCLPRGLALGFSIEWNSIN